MQQCIYPLAFVTNLGLDLACSLKCIHSICSSSLGFYRNSFVTSSFEFFASTSCPVIFVPSVNYLPHDKPLKLQPSQETYHAKSNLSFFLFALPLLIIFDVFARGRNYASSSPLPITHYYKVLLDPQPANQRCATSLF